VWDLPTTMTKLLHFGMKLDEVVRRTTSVPAKIMGYEGTIGTLKPGANADISVFELRNDKFELHDSDSDTIAVKQRLLVQTTVKDGRMW
jgi:dihydroorotase